MTRARGAKEKQTCPYCGESFKCVNIHISKKHGVRTKSKKFAKGSVIWAAKRLVLAALF